MSRDGEWGFGFHGCYDILGVCGDRGFGREYEGSKVYLTSCSSNS